MEEAHLHPAELERLAALFRYDILDTEPEAAFDEITELASAICETPIALISLVDKDRQWFKSTVGISATQTPRSLAFCAHALLQDGVFEVPNALNDERFCDNPLVVGEPSIRFYAGALLVADDGLPLGTLCVIDSVPKKLTPQKTRALTILAGQVMAQIKLRLQNQNLQRLNQYREQLFAALSQDLRSPVFGINGLSKLIRERGARLSAENVVVASEAILNSSLLMYQLLDELIQWSQLSLGVTSISSCRLPLWNKVNDICNLLDFNRDSKGIKILNNIPPDVFVLSDELVIKTVLRNLISNAIKYSPYGGDVTLECVVEGDKVQIVITDQGAGVPKALEETIFNPPSPPHEYNHHGFGLMLCRRFLQLQGNKISLVAGFTPGARFIFDLNKA